MSPAYRYAYLHGFASNARSKKGLALQERFARTGVELWLPDLNRPSFAQLSHRAMLAHLDALDDVERLGPPPYVVVVTAVRAGDPIIARVGSEGSDGEARDVHLGERAELEAWIAARESGRWPIVGLLGIMGIVSLALGVRGLRG